MRRARIKVTDQPAVYHCISRIVGGDFLLDDLAKERFRLMMWEQADFCGLSLITYALMANHVHLMVRVPQSHHVDDSTLLNRVRRFYGPEDLLTLSLQSCLEQQGRIDPLLRHRLLRRMGDVSAFMKELKQRFSRAYNQQHDRFGTLWAERFQSVLIEDQPDALGSVAAYIDLNPVRAGIVADPKDYRFCGYAEAMGGNPLAQAGLMSFHPSPSWEQTAAEYRTSLFVKGAVVHQAAKVAMDRHHILAVLKEEGRISRAEALRLRVRYFSAGVALGSKHYVDGVFQQFRNRFSQKRKTGARIIRKLPFNGLFTLRQLRIAPFG